MLRVVWPDHTPNRAMDLVETIYLDANELVDVEGPIVDPKAEQIVLAVESLRSRSIASRYMSITGKLRAEVERVGGEIIGIGAHRAISIRLDDGRTIWAYPVVGIPTAELLNDVADKAREANQDETPMLVTTTSESVSNDERVWSGLMRTSPPSVPSRQPTRAGNSRPGRHQREECDHPLRRRTGPSPWRRVCTSADTVAITAAVSALVHVVLGRRLLIWGGQPAITP
ncbi:hypothetical protein J2793_005148 [Paraburkholderia caledonica]|uniref:Uncharacterized protein n=1 Tax=Paraburkholderia caledonica TaxID=134536 RepID=A0AB73II81_9BURK|nr:hypothetical protein [Paraburkholderia caledonica]